ncbi:hypothetical protein [Rubrivirga sp. IMCC43871]|uniref:hypothetical protein n=1 Tax=Rubrivirga sp. IMCC43871 TaxID=3391575 RepID=UPI00398F9D6A
MTRRYSEEEAQRIFALVAERQRTASGVEGLSLAELEEAASAAGLDPGLVAVAAAELDSAPHPEKTLLGTPTEVIRSRVLDRPIDDDTWASMVGAARREFGQPGMAGQIGRLREWTVISGGTKNGITTRLTVEPTDRGARVTLSRSIRDTVFGLTLASGIQWAMSVFFGIMWMAGVDTELWIPALILASFGTLFGAGIQIGARVWRRREARRFEGLLDRLELIALDSPPTAASASAAPEGRIDPALLDVDAPDTESARDATRDRTR